MPGGDRTGPWGEGPLTGRKMGFCAGYDVPGYMNMQTARGGGFGRRFRGGSAYGRGYGLGFRHGQTSQHWEGLADVSERTMIENQIRVLKDQLSALEERLSKLEDK